MLQLDLIAIGFVDGLALHAATHGTECGGLLRVLLSLASKHSSCLLAKATATSESLSLTLGECRRGLSKATSKALSLGLLLSEHIW